MDIDDSGDMPASPPLREILEHCQKHIFPAYEAANRTALDFQSRHRRRARLVAWFGAAAVILAELQLLVPAVSQQPDSLWSDIRLLLPRLHLSLIEALAVIGLLFLVLGGMRRSLKEEYILERFKAERLRLLKFSFLLQPELWSGSVHEIQRCKDLLVDRVRDITAATHASLKGWGSQGTVPQVGPAPIGPRAGALRELEDYYRRKRLGYQMDYVSSAMKRLLRRDQSTRLTGPVLFFGSVSFVMAHLAAEFAHGENLSAFLIFVAAALPTLGAAIRTVRSTDESARNASRYEANYYILSKLSERLRTAPDAATAFREMGFCEQVLEADHREWMRLMVEAEWFG